MALLPIELKNLPRLEFGHGDEPIPLAQLMPALIAAALKGADKLIPLPEDDQGYDSTYEYCVNVFKEQYTPQVKEMMDSFDKNPVTVCISGNGTGKTHCAARCGCATLLRFQKSQVWTAAAPPESNLKLLMWGEIGSLYQSRKKLFRDFRVSLPGMTIARKNDAKSFMRGVTIPATGTEAEQEARFSGKHAPILVFMLDEADAIPWAVFKGIESCLSGGRGRLLIMFNPRHQSGAVYQMIREEAANVVTLEPFKHPNVVTGQDIFPGAVDRNTTGRRILRWTKPLKPGERADSECYQVPMFFDGFQPVDFNGKLMDPIIGGQWRRVVEASFFYMVLAKYPTQASNQLVNRKWVERAQENWVRQVDTLGIKTLTRGRPTAGLDVAEYGRDRNVLTFVHRSFMDVPEEWGGVDVLVTADTAAEHCLARRALYCNVDSTGVGAGVVPGMVRAGFENANRIMFASSPPEEEMDDKARELGEFRIMRDFAWWSIARWLENDPKAALPPIKELEDDLLTATYEVKKGQINIMASDVMREINKGRSPDYGTSAALAVMGELVTQDSAGEFGSQNYVKGKQRPMVVGGKGRYGND